jgi:GntR family transcriptional regulator
MINPHADRAAYRQIADLLRAQIQSGEYPVGSVLPAEKRIAQENGVGRDTVRTAMGLLRAEGWIETHRPVGSRVRSPERVEVLVDLGSEWLVRTPTLDERTELGLREDDRVVEVTYRGDVRVFAADRHVFRSV